MSGRRQVDSPPGRQTRLSRSRIGVVGSGKTVSRPLKTLVVGAKKECTEELRIISLTRLVYLVSETTLLGCLSATSTVLWITFSAHVSRLPEDGRGETECNETHQKAARRRQSAPKDDKEATERANAHRKTTKSAKTLQGDYGAQRSATKRNERRQSAPKRTKARRKTTKRTETRQSAPKRDKAHRNATDGAKSATRPVVRSAQHQKTPKRLQIVVAQLPAGVAPKFSRASGSRRASVGMDAEASFDAIGGCSARGRADSGRPAGRPWLLQDPQRPLRHLPAIVWRD